MAIGDFQNPSWKETFSGFLEEEPRAAFFGTLAMAGKAKPGDPLYSPGFQSDTAARRRQAQDIYGQALSDFYGKLGEQIMSGEAPTMKFTDFLSSQDMPFTERFAQQGRQFNELSRYRPRTRYLYY